MAQFLAICRQDLLSCAAYGMDWDEQPKRAWPTFLALLGEIESVLLSLQDSSFISSGNKHTSTLGRAVDNTQWISLRLSCIILFTKRLW